MTNGIKNTENFEKLYNELTQWMYGNDHDGSLEYAFNNDYQLHAVSLWEGSGASQYDFSAGIGRRAETKEIKELCDSADIYICPDCNHYGFYQKGELEEAPQCMSCLGNNMELDTPKIDIQKEDRVKATSGHFEGKSGYVTRIEGSQACVVWKGVWDHGIWVDLTDLKRTKRYKTKEL